MVSILINTYMLFCLGDTLILNHFIGGRISHEWCVPSNTGQTQWYKGTVLDILKGQDGSPSAVYEVLYDEENSPHEVDNLQTDFNSGSVKFIDV